MPHRIFRWTVVGLALSTAIQVGIVLVPQEWVHAVMGTPRGVRAARTQEVLAPNGISLVDVFDFGPAGTIVYLDWDRSRGDYRLMHPERSRELTPVAESILPRWSALPRGELPADATATDPSWLGFHLEEREEGWPMRCIRGEKRMTRVRSDGPPGWAAVTSRVGYIGLQNGIWIPCQPLWTGLALDVVLLATPWVMAQWLWARGTAARRRGRGQCEGCGYDLASIVNVCPECGGHGRRA
ncbi:MAG TPA: hypothetical protein VFF69_08145 [Phycisphaerales bacterium]|nr:hypothetical protein [Phycisphaerales bacterium]